MLSARRFASINLFVAVVFVAIFSGPAHALDKPKPAVPTVGQMKIGPSKLSEGECTQLGGKLETPRRQQRCLQQWKVLRDNGSERAKARRLHHQAVTLRANAWRCRSGRS